MKPIRTDSKYLRTKPNSGGNNNRNSNSIIKNTSVKSMTSPINNGDVIDITSPINKVEREIGVITEDSVYKSQEVNINTIDIPARPTGSVDIVKNGTYNVTKYAEAKVRVPTSGADIYEGDYIVTPSAHRDIILETTNKVMEDDVTVVQIPYYETSNVTGYTVYIADSV